MRVWAVVRNGEPLEQVERPPREPVGTEVLLEVTHAGVCHSDLHFWKGYYDMGGGKLMRLTDRGVQLPRAPGHEVVGRVIALGPQAQGAQVGDLRIVFPWLGCGICEACRQGDDNLCMSSRAIGVIQDGGFGGQVLVPDARFLVDPGALDPAYASTLACSGITVYSAIRKLPKIAPDEPIVLFGAGGLGLAAIAMLRALEHRNIVSVDISADKREAALEMGASHFIDGSGEGVLERIQAVTGGPVVAALDFVNASATATTGLELLKKGGTLVLVGVAGGQLVLSLASMVFRPRSIRGSVTGNPQDLRDVVALAQSGKLKPIPVETLPKDQANTALQMLGEGRVKGRLVLAG